MHCSINIPPTHFQPHSSSGANLIMDIVITIMRIIHWQCIIIIIVILILFIIAIFFKVGNIVGKEIIGAMQCRVNLVAIVVIAAVDVVVAIMIMRMPPSSTVVS